MRPRIIGRHWHPDYIINMDQTPIFFSMNPGTTLDQVGVRSVNVRTSTSSTVRVTLAVTISASGKSLTPMMVYKGGPTKFMSHNHPSGIIDASVLVFVRKTDYICVNCAPLFLYLYERRKNLEEHGAPVVNSL